MLFFQTIDIWNSYCLFSCKVNTHTFATTQNKSKGSALKKTKSQKIVKVKRLLIFLFLAVLIHSAYGQRRIRIENLPSYDLKPYHFGFVLGLNQMDFSIKPIENYKPLDSLYVLESTPEWGFYIGIVSDLRLGEFFNLRFITTLSFGDRNLQYLISFKDTIFYNQVKKVESTLLEFPLLMKYKGRRMTNTRPYLIGGVKYTLDLASKQEKKDHDEILVKIYQDDYAYEVGVGFDFYLEYFKFSLELKMAYGIHDLLVRENNIFTDPIDRLSSKTFQISFLFE